MSIWRVLIGFIWVLVAFAKPGRGEPPRDNNSPCVPCFDAVMNMSHYDWEDGIRRGLDEKVMRDGIELVIHKVTQGTADKDNDRRYVDVKSDAAKLNLPWGAYHFANAVKYEDIPTTPSQQDWRKRKFKRGGVEQADHFLKRVMATKGDEKRVLLAWDLEYSNEKLQEHMDLLQAAAAIEEIWRVTGKYPGLYTGARFSKDHIGDRKKLDDLFDPQNNTHVKDVLGRCWLWLAQYDNYPDPPKLPSASPWDAWTIWQYTTNLKELEGGMGIPRSPRHRHDVGGCSGEFCYVTIPRGQQLKNWFEEKSWDYKPLHPFPVEE